MIIIGGGAALALKNKKTDDKMMVEDQAMMEKDDKMMAADQSGYVEYSEKSFEAARASKRVLFFHAGWCPTCKPVNEELTEKIKEIPEGVVVFKVDYDTVETLKKKYEITYQHTFVLVDEAGVELDKWNGGGLAEVIEKTQ